MCRTWKSNAFCRRKPTNTRNGKIPRLMKRTWLKLGGEHKSGRASPILAVKTDLWAWLICRISKYFTLSTAMRRNVNAQTEIVKRSRNVRIHRVLYARAVILVVVETITRSQYCKSDVSITWLEMSSLWIEWRLNNLHRTVLASQLAILWTIVFERLFNRSLSIRIALWLDRSMDECHQLLCNCKLLLANARLQMIRQFAAGVACTVVKLFLQAICLFPPYLSRIKNKGDCPKPWLGTSGVPSGTSCSGCMRTLHLLVNSRRTKIELYIISRRLLILTAMHRTLLECCTTPRCSSTQVSWVI